MNEHQLITRNRVSSLSLAELCWGRYFEIALPKTRLADDVLTLAAAGSLGAPQLRLRAEARGEGIFQAKAAKVDSVDLVAVGTQVTSDLESLWSTQE